MRRIIAFFKKETVLCIAAVCAILSMFAVPPDMTYLEYIDLRVLCLLFCLMAVILGMQDCGLFGLLAQKLLRGQKSLRALLLILVLLPFFVSMLVTNDVALITFVPFTLMVLEAAGAEHLMIKTVVLQTVAANLGSMATPVGNPQNLYLYSYYQLTGGQFFGVMLPADTGQPSGTYRRRAVYQKQPDIGFFSSGCKNFKPRQAGRLYSFVSALPFVGVPHSALLGADRCGDYLLFVCPPQAPSAGRFQSAAHLLLLFHLFRQSGTDPCCQQLFERGAGAKHAFEFRSGQSGHQQRPGRRTAFRLHR